MSFRLVLKSVTLNDLKRRNGHFQMIRAELTTDESRTTWRKIRNRMNILCIICVVNLHCCHYYISCGFLLFYVKPKNAASSVSISYSYKSALPQIKMSR